MKNFSITATALLILFAVIGGMNMQTSTRETTDRVEELKNFYSLKPHVEGGSFAEVYTAPFQSDGRATAGSIFFLLEGGDVSHFHQIDCDEIWYFHEGCGLKIFAIKDGGAEEILLGGDVKLNHRAMVVIPAGTVFAAENLDKDSYTFVSCATTPKFSYDGFKLFSRQEILKIYPAASENILRLAQSEVSQ